MGSTECVCQVEGATAAVERKQGREGEHRMKHETCSKWNICTSFPRSFIKSCGKTCGDEHKLPVSVFSGRLGDVSIRFNENILHRIRGEIEWMSSAAGEDGNCCRRVCWKSPKVAASYSHPQAIISGLVWNSVCLVRVESGI